jgi:hypothetical protein
LTVGQRETITYRGKIVQTTHSESFSSPTYGIGYGLGDGLGIVLHHMMQRGNAPRRAVLRATGTVIEENDEYVTLELPSGRKLKIRVSDIVRRKVLHS